MLIPASRLVDLCAEAYDAAPDIRGRGFNEDIHLIVREPAPGIMVVAARGSTMDIKDWLHDFDARPVWVETFNSSMHKGIQMAADSVLLDAVQAVGRAKQLVFTGHSLGGGIALILSALFVKGGIQSNVVTFGAPRVGMRGFSKFFRDRQMHPIMFRHGGDPVPQVPRFITWGLDWYRHPGYLRQLGHDIGLPVISDHFLAYYKRAVLEWERGTCR